MSQVPQICAEWEEGSSGGVRLHTQGRGGFFSCHQPFYVRWNKYKYRTVRALSSQAALRAILLEVHHYPCQFCGGSLSNWMAGAEFRVAWYWWGSSACLFWGFEMVLIEVSSVCFWTSSHPDACSCSQLMKTFLLLVMVIWLKCLVLLFPVTWISTEFKVTCSSTRNSGWGPTWSQLMLLTSA